MPLIMSFDQNFLNVFPLLSLKLELNMPLSLMREERERERDSHFPLQKVLCLYLSTALCCYMRWCDIPRNAPVSAHILYFLAPFN